MGPVRRSRSPALSAALALLMVAGMLLAPMLAAPSPAAAASGIAITGSFYRQPFEIPRGGSAFGPSIYVVVSNQGTDAFNVRMVTAAVTTDNVPEPGISVNLSRTSFSLQPGAQQRIDIRVEVAEGVPAGQYEVAVTAESYRDSGGGITLSGSAGQTASLTVAGESATVAVSTVGPSGQPVIAQVRLFRMVNGSGYEVASSNTGSLQAKVAPGGFSAEAYSLTTGDQLCEPAAFDIAGGETKTITLTARTVYFENDFVVNANYDSQTGQLLNARTLATLTNVLEMMSNTEVRLAVTRNGDPLETITVLGPLSLPVGQTGVPWNYIPSDGWKGGRYGFSYQLYVGGLFVAQTAEQTLEVGAGGGVASWLWIVFVALGIVGVGGLGLAVFSVIKNRRKGEPKAKKEKKRKAEKPGRRPEPAAEPEPETVTPVVPAPQPQPAKAAKAVPAAKAAPVPAVQPPKPAAAPKPVQQPKPPAPVPSPKPVQQVKPVPQPKPPAPVPSPKPVQQVKPVPQARPAQAVQQPRPVAPGKAVPPAQPARAAQPPVERAAPLAAVSSLKARMASLGQDQRLGRDTDEDDEAEEPEAPSEDRVEVTVVPDEAPPVEAAAAEAEPEPVASETVEEAVAVEDESDIVSSVTVTRSEPPAAVGQPVSEQTAPHETEAEQTAVPPDETAPVEEAAPVSEAAFLEQPAATDDVPVAGEAAPSEQDAAGDLDTEAEAAPPPPPVKSSFIEAAKLRMQAREHASVGSGGDDEGQPPAA